MGYYSVFVPEDRLRRSQNVIIGAADGRQARSSVLGRLAAPRTSNFSLQLYGGRRISLYLVQCSEDVIRLSGPTRRVPEMIRSVQVPNVISKRKKRRDKNTLLCSQPFASPNITVLLIYQIRSVSCSTLKPLSWISEPFPEACQHVRRHRAHCRQP